MAPIKALNSNIPTNGIMTRSKSIGSKDIIPTKRKAMDPIGTKRKAVDSPAKAMRTLKRAAFNELTNYKNQENIQAGDPKKPVEIKKALRNVNINIPQKTTTILKKSEFGTSRGVLNRLPPLPPPKPLTRPSIAKNVLRRVGAIQNQENKFFKKDLVEKKTKVDVVEKKVRPPPFKVQTSTFTSSSASTSSISSKSTSSSESSKQDQTLEPSLYETAIEEATTSSDASKLEPVEEKIEIPEGVEVFDTDDDPNNVSIYAMEIFNYMKTREVHFPISDYMTKQTDITPWMRALLVDWMVEVQESFELNHETLYLAVKIVDLYLNKVLVAKETLQLIGAAALFISCKYDERIPPLVEDFLYICDGAYSHSSLIKMEVRILKGIGFDLGIPLSYRFLRRYARASRMAMPTLTLARYILEFSLMDYTMTSWSDSKMAASCLYLAMQMKSIGDWTSTLEFYTSYKKEELKKYVTDLNAMLHKPPKESLSTIRNKYSHKIFFEVAKLPLLDDSDLKLV